MPSEESGRATLFDGVTARAHPVTVTVTGGGIAIEPSDSANPPQCPLSWPWAGSHAVNDGRTDRLTLTVRDAPDARLVVADPALRSAIRPRLQGSALHLPQRRTAIRWALGLGASVVLLVLAAGLATRHAAAFLPAGWGGRLSDGVLEQLSEEHPTCDGAAGLAGLDRMAGRMTAVLDAPPAKVTVVRWDLVNAFALPGGRILLTSGLIDRAASPQALAAVLAHEVGHVARRDPLAGMLREKLVDVALAAVFGVSLDIGATSTVAGFLLDASYTREQEEGADAEAVRILNALEIAPGPGAEFFDRLAEDDRGLGAVTLLRTHPLSAERAALLRRRGTGSGPGLTAEEWHAVETVCR